MSDSFGEGRKVGAWFGGEGLEESDETEREEGCQEEGVALREIVVPGVAAVEDGEGLGDVEVEEAERRKGPLLVVETVDDEREAEDQDPDEQLA